MRRLVLAMIVLSIVPALAMAQAADFDITLEKPGRVLAGTMNQVGLTIENSGSNEYFSVSVLGGGGTSGWINVENPFMRVEKGSSASTNIIISPPKSAVPKTYSFTVTVTKRGTSEKVEKDVLLYVEQPQAMVAITDFDLDCGYCGNEVTASISAKNVGTATLEDVVIFLNIGTMTKEIDIGAMDMLETGSGEVTFSLDGLDPGSYSIKADASADGNTLDTETRSFTISPIEAVDFEREETSNILGRFITITASNNGNIPTTAQITSEVNTNFYTVYSGPKPDSVGEEWAWNVDLDAGDSMKLSYAEFIWPMPVGLIALILGAVYGFLFMTSVSVSKSVRKYGDLFSVSLGIKNRGGKTEGVVVRDIIPHHFHVSSRFESLRPTARKTAIGTELIWKLGNMKRGEERALNYKIKPRPHAKGTVRLPSARVRAKKGGRDKFTNSNSPVISGLGGERLRIETE